MRDNQAQTVCTLDEAKIKCLDRESDEDDETKHLRKGEKTKNRNKP